MFHHLSTPSRAARQKVSSAEHWKAASPNWDRNTPTRSSRLTGLREQLSFSLEAAGQAGGGQAEVLGVHRSCGKTGRGEFSCFPLSPRTEFMMFCE